MVVIHIPSRSTYVHVGFVHKQPTYPGVLQVPQIWFPSRPLTQNPGRICRDQSPHNQCRHERRHRDGVLGVCLDVPGCLTLWLGGTKHRTMSSTGQHRANMDRHGLQKVQRPTGSCMRTYRRPVPSSYPCVAVFREPNP